MILVQDYTGKLKILLDLYATELKELRQEEGSHAEKLGSLVHTRYSKVTGAVFFQTLSQLCIYYPIFLGVRLGINLVLIL